MVRIWYVPSHIKTILGVFLLRTTVFFAKDHSFLLILTILVTSILIRQFPITPPLNTADAHQAITRRAGAAVFALVRQQATRCSFRCSNDSGRSMTWQDPQQMQRRCSRDTSDLQRRCSATPTKTGGSAIIERGGFHRRQILREHLVRLSLHDRGSTMILTMIC